MWFGRYVDTSNGMVEREMSEICLQNQSENFCTNAVEIFIITVEVR